MSAETRESAAHAVPIGWNGHRAGHVSPVVAEDEPRKSLVERATEAHRLWLVFAAVAAVGFSAAMFVGGLVRQEDLRRERDRTEAALDGIQNEVRALSARVGPIEVVLGRVDRAVDQIAQRLNSAGVGMTSVPSPKPSP